MKINKKSWHYRLMVKIKIVDPYRPPQNLCDYMMATFSLLFALVCAVAAVTLFLVLPLLGSYTDLLNDEGFYIGLGVVFWLTVLGVYIFKLIDDKLLDIKLEKAIRQSREYANWTDEQWDEYRTKLDTKKVNIFSQWLKDRREKICTLIEYE